MTPRYRLAPALALVLALAPLGAAAHAGEFVPPASCPADLAAVDATFDGTLARLKGVSEDDPAELCAAVKHHVEVMENAAAVFQRCLPEGHDKRENLGQVIGTDADFRDISANHDCPPLPDPPPFPDDE
jgi:hypothetical protein